MTGDLIRDSDALGQNGQPLTTVVGVAAYLFGVELTILCEDVRLG